MATHRALEVAYKAKPWETRQKIGGQIVDTPALRKARGAFFTPPELTEFITHWAIQTPEDTILEPSCGEAAFLLPAAHRLASLKQTPKRINKLLHGVDIHAASIAGAKSILAQEGFGAEIVLSDFFDIEAKPLYDAVIGNPPYVRYQNFTGEQRAKALQAALAQGVRLTGLASSWAAFTVHAAQFLKPEGRLGLVLPAELLSVNYAAQVRSFLLRRFKTVRLVMFEDLIFPGVLEEVVLLLAEGSGGARSFEVYQAKNLQDLENLHADQWSDFTPEAGAKWTPALLPADAFATYQELVEGAHFEKLLDWGETYLGVVTGHNKYFTLTRAQVAELGLTAKEVLKISPPGARHLRGLTFEAPAWESLAKDGSRCYLFYPPDDALSEAAQRYIAQGEKDGVHKGFKCRNRKPWWRVPLVSRPDLFFTYMNHDRPRLTTNGAKAHLLNSLYGIELKDDRRTTGVELLPVACLNSATLLGAEMVGRSYGGGMLKHEPKEADLLPVPSLETLQAVGKRLKALKPQVALALRQDNLTRAIELVDQVLLQEYLGLPPAAIDSLRKAREQMFQRRIARGKGERAADE